MQNTNEINCLNPKKEENKKVSMAQILREELKNIPANTEFHMFTLAEKIRKELTKRTEKPCFMYTASILRQLRLERAQGNFYVVCVDHNKSIYKKLDIASCE